VKKLFFPPLPPSEKSTMKRLWILCAALLAVLMPLPASAQVDRATLTGTGCAVHCHNSREISWDRWIAYSTAL
jgi:hypothetical protein